MEERTDEELFAAYCGGDAGAFDALFERYAPQLMRIMRASLRNDDDARELVQQTFLQLHRARRDFRQGARLRPWLLTIAFNLRRSYFRRLGRRPEAPLVLEPVSRDDLTASTRMRRAEAATAVRGALTRLPENQRVVVELHWLEGLPFSEVAEVVGASVSAVKVRAHRAYKRLRELLEAP